MGYVSVFAAVIDKPFCRKLFVARGLVLVGIFYSPCICSLAGGQPPVGGANHACHSRAEGGRTRTGSLGNLQCQAFGGSAARAPRVLGILSPARAGSAGDFRSWLRPTPIVICSSKTQAEVFFSWQESFAMPRVTSKPSAAGAGAASGERADLGAVACDRRPGPGSGVAGGRGRAGAGGGGSRRRRDGCSVGRPVGRRPGVGVMLTLGLTGRIWVWSAPRKLVQVL